MTEKLYYEDQYLGRFTAKVLKQDMDAKERHYIVLDKTAFYPTGGGQPNDNGTINGIEVYDVEEIDGEIRHYIPKPIDIQKECIGEINWERRMDHMQQHAGQHILSAAFEEELGYSTVSFHLGRELCTIDITTNQLTEEEVIQVEKIANLIIIENRPIETKWVTKEELNNYKLRKELSVTDNIRLVIIPDFDYNGCGGTHPKSTGEVGSIHILHWEKQKKQTRLYFICGRRVRHQLREKHLVIQNLSRLLSSPQEHLEEAVKHSLLQAKEYEKTISDLKMELINYEAKFYIEQVEMLKGNQIIKLLFEDRTIAELQQLAKKITGLSSEVFVCIVNETGDKLQLICAKGEKIPTSMNQLVKDALPKINGKGGGNDKIAQGGGEKLISKEELLETLVQMYLE